MITVQVENATKELSRAFSFLSKKQIAIATTQALNKTLLKGRTVARTAVKHVYNIPQKNLSGIGIKKATTATLSGYIYASAKPIPMDAFSPKFQLVSDGKVRGIQTISKRGIVKVKIAERSRQQSGVSIEVIKGQRVTVPYAFMLPTAKPRVFARGEYKQGDGNYGFMQRHYREENQHGNDSVKPLVSVTVFAAVINRKVKNEIATTVRTEYTKYMISAIKYQATLAK